MKVYVLMCNYCDVDSGDFANDIVGVYQNLNKAKEEMVKLVTDIRDDFECYDTEEETTPDSWSIWEKGEWVNRHCSVVICRKEIQ